MDASFFLPPVTTTTIASSWPQFLLCYCILVPVNTDMCDPFA